MVVRRLLAGLLGLYFLLPSAAWADPGSYPGRASYPVYNALFSRGPAMPHLATHVPQGLAYYAAKNWLVASAYHEDGRSRSILTVIDRASGRRLKTVSIEPGQVAGLAIGRHLWVTHSAGGRHDVRRYSLTKLVAAQPGATLSYDASFPVRASSYVAVDGSSLYVGTESGSYGTAGRLYRYAVSAAGKVASKASATIAVPGRVNGVVVTQRHILFSRSGTRGQASLLTVWNRSTGRASTMAAPSLATGMTRVGNRVYLVFASGADPYDGPVDPARNIIKSLHHASHAAMAARTES